MFVDSLGSIEFPLLVCALLVAALMFCSRVSLGSLTGSPNTPLHTAGRQAR